MIEEALRQGWENFIARTTGPLSLRFIMQPAVAAFLAIRAGVRDAHAGRPAFFWSLLTGNGTRRALLREGLKDTGKVFILALVLDCVYQLLVQGRIYILELLFTALTLAFIPYLLIRGPVNRLTLWTRRASEGGINEPHPRQ